MTPWEAHVLIKACEAMRENDSAGRYTQEEIDEAGRLIPRLRALAGDVTDPAR